MRTLGALGLSVGTSLAFELGGGSHVYSTDTLMVNLRTLVRNAHQAYEKDQPGGDNPETLANDVESDLKLLAQWLNTQRKGKPIQFKVYCPSYSGLPRAFPKADLFLPQEGTEKQKAQYTLYEKTLAILLKRHGKLILQTDLTLPEFTGKGLIITHHTVDLTQTQAVGRLSLLESYTGAVKPYTLWYTKFNNGDELNFMPFNRLTIQIFGDKNTNFRQSSKAIRELVKKIAQENRWTSATSMSRVRSTIHSLPQGVDRSGLQMML